MPYLYVARIGVLNFSAIIPSTAGAIVAVAVTVLLLKTVRAEAEPADGEIILQYGKSLRWLVSFFWVCCVGGFIVVLLAPPSTRVVAAIVVSIFFFANLSLHLELHYVQIKYDSSGITTVSPWRSSRRIPWSDVKIASYSAVARWYVIDTVSFGRIRLHDYLNGVQSLLDELVVRRIEVQRAGN